MANEKAMLRVSTVNSAGGAVIRLAGPLDIATTGQLEEGVANAMSQHHSVSVDMTDVTVCDSAGLGALVRLHRRAVAAGKVLELYHPRPHVADLLAMTGINKVIRVVMQR